MRNTNWDKDRQLVNIGIYYTDIEALKRRLRAQEKIRILVESWCDPGSEGAHKKMETCQITGVYPHLATFRRPCGLTISYTHQELIVMGL